MVLFLSSTVLNAQNQRDPWAVTVGAHAVDYTSVRGVFNEYFNYHNYTMVPPLSKLSVIRNLGRWFDIDLTASVGEVDNKRLRINDELFINAGLGLRFKILKGTSWFDPYLRIGANYNHYDFTSLGDNVPYGFPVYGNHNGDIELNPDGTPLVVDYLYEEPKTGKHHLGVSGGAGINFWFTKNFGLNVASDYNWIPSAKTDYFDFFQHSVGVTFRFGNKDRDGDGILDEEDDCPDTPGIASSYPGCNGCPDTDGDGLCDDLDDCPEEAGPIDNNGCPILDRDGDGILDVDDDCPDTPGVASSIPGCNGCPDRDGDGVCDDKDDCPDVFGTVENNGCPVVTTVDCADLQAIKDAIKSVLFEYNSDKLTPESMVTLDRIAPILTDSKIKNPRWLVEGHTDNKGSQNYNLPLSERRATSVMNYLISKGVPASSLKAVGFGLALPITTNDTEAGRARNRRVELKFADANFQPAALEVADDCADIQIADFARNIYFQTAKAELVEASKQSLDVIAQYLNATTGNYEIQGHTDDVGNDANNLALSQRRAQTVLDYLVSKGVSGSRLKAVGYGESAPKYDNKTADGRAQNRRIEIVKQQ
ncbi:MAG: OmpA family protein [Weeksellaceae bacterium]